MNITPEMKAQIEEQKKQCVYCKIVSGEMEGKVVYEDDVCLAILDIYPAVKGHVVFLFKEHYPIMPYVPPEEFKHYFGLIPGLSNSIKKAMVTMGINFFLANGGPAGQQFPHVLGHFFPREKGDGFFNLMLKRKYSLEEKSISMLGNNLPIMMGNHFKRNPAEWHVGKGDVPGFLAKGYEGNSVVYEDEKVLCVIPPMGFAEGHIEIYSKEEESSIENLNAESAAHLFFTASFAATALFEGLGAHGTNIILKSGEGDDNPGGKLVVHVLARKQEDGLESMMWQPKQPEYDLDSVAGKIKDKTWNISEAKKKKKKSVAPVMPEKIKIGGSSKSSGSGDGKGGSGGKDEIRRAIENL